MPRFVLSFLLSTLATTVAFAEDEKPIYENNLEKAAEGSWPDELFKVAGEFAVAKDGENKVIELPGDPAETFTVLFGPSEAFGLQASARIFGTKAKRNAPAFGVGLNGASGFVLRMSPNKDMLEIAQEDQTKASVAYKWKSGSWTLFKIQSRALSDTKFIIEGKAWEQGQPEPDKWMVTLELTEKPPAGRSTLYASPLAGTPLRFDDLKIVKAK
jgi:hypothetical protein